nr:immunoglobulin heavy chain junction region [Macaca mulatta]MOW23238.1 immunoglobulin heavy chain junction region [Macaca mulatta]MOW23322.1 immunoglobulin heavy chain junction region [Macaca mulatta]MOW23385.1 immunoglobulin heavy chain junction region [Macaca mulatta]MOW23558.1 immunoglobulin heavy chain junction region [Macaca mulatta]
CAREWAAAGIRPVDDW